MCYLNGEDAGIVSSGWLPGGPDRAGLPGDYGPDCFVRDDRRRTE